MKKTGTEKLQIFLIGHINKIYCAKAHVVERLPEILDHVCFIDLKHAIEETIIEMEKQIAEMDKIYDMLQINYSFENFTSLINSLDSAFIAIQNQSADPDLRDLFIISYLYMAESIEMASFQILHTLSGTIMSSEIKYLLKRSADAAKADRALLLLITKKYFKS